MQAGRRDGSEHRQVSSLSEISAFRGRFPELVIPAPEGDAAQARGAPAKWYHAGPPVVAPQGWKLYVSASRPFFLETLAAAGNVFASFGVSYKYAASDKVLRKLNAGLYGYSQIGKVIIAYFAEGDDPSPVVQGLKDALCAFRHRAPLPPFALPIGGGLPLSYRFGSFDGGPLRVNGVLHEDDRTRNPLWIRDLVADPFLSLCEPPVARKDFDRLLGRFPVYEVLAQGGKGGIYAAFDLDASEFRDLVLKVGFRYGQILPDGRDGMDLLRHEHAFFGLLEDRSLADVAPRLQGYFEFDDRNVLVLERIPGADLLKRKHEGTLTVDHLGKALRILSRLHRAGLFVGDPKLANFIADAAGRVRAVDFESAGTMVRPHFDLLRTFHFVRPGIKGIPVGERIHLLYSVLHRTTESSFSESDRIIDLVDFIESFKPRDAIERWALAQLEGELRNGAVATS